MNPDDGRRQSRLLMLRPHPWARHLTPPESQIPAHRSRRDAARNDAGDANDAPFAGRATKTSSHWLLFLAGRLSAIEERVQRLGAAFPGWHP
ncbi:hypothetical protein BH23GEM9_BH23GEM9_35920 [soil metagenome]